MTKNAPLLVAPSILSADFARLGEEVAAIDAAGADWIHLDVMDGHFVPNISFGPAVIKALRSHSRLPFDVHLMIEPCDPYLQAFAEAGADHIVIHIEGGPHVHRSLQTIRALGKKAGVAICPATPASALSEILDLVDIVLVMTVNPGFGGQKFLQSQFGKIREILSMIEKSGRAIRIGVDGGVDRDTAPMAIEAGADFLVAGSAVYGQDDYAAAISALRSASQGTDC